MSFDLALVRRFEAVCRLRSFSRAADELGLSHSALTKSIRSLEEGLNLRLIERTTRSLAPTEAGQRLFSLAPDLLAHSDDVKAAILAETARLSVICGPVVLDALGNRALLEFRAAHPNVHVALQTVAAAIAAEQLAQRRADLLLVHSNVARQIADRKTFVVEEIVSEPYVVLFRRGHPIAQTDLSLEVMLKFDWVVAGFDNLFQEALPPAQRELLLRRGFPKYRISSLSACADMVDSTDLLTLAPATAAAALIEGRALANASLPGKALFSVCAVARAEAVESLHIRGFIDAVARAHARVPHKPRRKSPT